MEVQQDIVRDLEQAFAPTYIDVANESHMHSVPANSETHFRVVLVSERFEGARQVGRHQQVYGALSAQLKGPVHALALHTYTPAEWSARQESAPASPECLGGSKAEQDSAV